MEKITPFLWFDNQAEEAANLYVSIFSRNMASGSTEEISKILNSARYSEEGAKASGKPKGTVMIANFEIYRQKFTALNGGPVKDFTFNSSISFFVNCNTQEEINGLWKALSDGGKVLMGLDKYPFSENFGWVDDKFGVSWQLNLGARAQKITPFLWFDNKAEEAIHYYTSLFKNSSINRIEHFGKNERGPEGLIKHGLFSLNDQEFMAMDTNKQHFTPATSFLINCETQNEVDEFWEKLSSGGKTSQCGWLDDKFGVTWQVVPVALGKLMSDPNPEKSRRVMKAMLQMTKIDIKTLEQAYNEV
jgi:predicted 3-demethylubiquinone-9 3-methyltransferase (glyoxalase superfamily)